MNAKELATMLDNRQYGEETTPEIIKLAKDNGLVIVFAYSDDNCEFKGAFDEEIPCWEGTDIHFNKDGTNFTDSHGEAFLTYHTDKDEPEKNMIKAVWCGGKKIFHTNGDYYQWTYETVIPHGVFDIMDGGEPSCRGIVFSINDLQ